MSVTKRGGIYHYEFVYRGERHRGSTGQRTKDQALRVEQQIRDRVRARAHGLGPRTPEESPSITAWADIALRRWPRASKRPAQLRNRIAVCLEFWGRRPTEPRPAPAAPRPGPPPDRPYHGLRLLHPIVDPAWILRFEDWMTARGISGSRKNQLRSTMSVLYQVARKPAHRTKTGVDTNPFAGGERDRVRSRTRVLSRAEIERWMAQAPYHLRVAMAVATYAPKLRLGNILALRFGQQIDAALTTITVTDHKADAHAPPLVVPIVDALRALLTFVRRQNRSAFVVEWEGAGVKSVQTAVRASLRAAGFAPGRATEDGVTFHTLRHSIATQLTLVPGLTERMRAEVMGQTIATAQKYTHLAAQHQVSAHAALAAQLPVGRAIVDGIFGGRAKGQAEGTRPVLLRRVPRKLRGDSSRHDAPTTVGTFVGSPDRPPREIPGESRRNRQARPTPKASTKS